MAKFGINDILNAKTKAAGQQAQTDGYKEIYLSPYEVKAAQENTHQKLENIEELADSFLHVGQEQPTVLARVNGEYRIIDGHRRNAANILNLERGHKEYEKVLYRFMDMSEAMYNLSADNDSGMIIYDNKFSELKQVESKPYTPNALQMQHIQENVCTHFGTNMDILQNKFDENTWNAYYEGKIEPFAIQLSLVMTNMSFTERERACGNAIFFSANRLQYASNATKLSVSTQLFDRALLNRNGVMDIWNMAHVEDGEKYYIRKEYTEVSELHKGSEQPVIIQQVQQQTEPAAGEEPQNGQEEKEGVNNAS